mmetsp:Transcript_47104/g.132833  ORF Transcript_47104/g.132833 Transcript_47104/m.132833 type:complete len:161 (+) Transcript_47104:78-560(+)
MGCSCLKGGGASDPQVLRDEAFARNLQRQEQQQAALGRGHQGAAPARQPGWNSAGAGHALGGGQGGGDAAEMSPEERRRMQREAAERRQDDIKGISKEKAAEMREKSQKEALLGKIAEHYNKKRLDMPMGLNSANVDQLRRHLEHVNSGGDAMAQQVLHS